MFLYSGTNKYFYCEIDIPAKISRRTGLPNELYSVTDKGNIAYIQRLQFYIYNAAWDLHAIINA